MNLLFNSALHFRCCKVPTHIIHQAIKKNEFVKYDSDVEIHILFLLHLNETLKKLCYVELWLLRVFSASLCISYLWQYLNC